MKHFTKHLFKNLKLAFLTGILFFGSTAVIAQVLDSKGKDFWLMFNTALVEVPPQTLTLFVTSDVNTSGTVTIPGLSFSSPFTVAANTVTPVIIPVAAAMHTNNIIDEKGIHVTALQEVTVYGLNRVPFITDAYLGIPTDALGTDHIVLTYSGFGTVEFGVVGTVNGTSVTITPTITAGGHPAGVPYNITLNRGQTYELRGSSAPADFTGTIITADQPIGVFGGNACANIPPGAVYCDHIVEMLPPTTTWGTKFGTVPLRSRLNGDTWRFLASENSTVVMINGIAQAPINRGQYLERLLTAQSVVESNKPILVAQYSNGSGFSGNPGDPSMMLIPPLEQFLAKYTVTTVSGFTAHFINIIAPSSIAGRSLTLDGAVVPVSAFTPIGSTGFSGAQLSVGEGTHNLAGSSPFGVFMYGFSSDNSYSYPGGQLYSEVASVDTIILTSQSGTAPVNTEQCFSALVKDALNNPLTSVRVDFVIKGVNSATSFDFTDSNGVAQFCFTGLAAGNDTITASVGSKSGITYFTWTADSCNLTLKSTKTDVKCFGAKSGAIDLTVSGGTAPYTYLWSNGATSEDLANIPAGTYFVTVKDAQGCENKDSVKVTEPIELTAYPHLEKPVSCYKGSDAVVVIYAEGGTPPYKYTIGKETNLTGIFTGLSAGHYTGSVTDANGCTINGSGDIEEPKPIEAHVKATGVNLIGYGSSYILFLVNDHQFVKLSAYAHGGSGEFTYDWGTAGKTQTVVVSPKKTTAYTVIIKDTNGCTKTCTTTIYVIDLRCCGSDLSEIPLISEISPNGTISENNLSVFKVYPNPATSYITIESSITSVLEQSELSIFDMQGKLMVNRKLNKGNINRIDVSVLRQGMYLVHLKSSGKVIVSSKINIVR